MKQTLTVFSPAKVNLQLEIGERRTDGFHQAKSIMQALTLHDMVTVVLDDGVDAYLNPDGFSDFAIDVTCTTFEGIPELDVAPESNIVYKAAAALAEKLGHEQGHISIHIEKHIPFEAGLGGGSSNAAAVIAGLCRAWGEDAASEAALDVARALGADVAFFLHGGCVQLGEKGDVLERTFEPARGTVVLVKIDEGVSTKAAYAAFDELAAVQHAESTDAIESAAELPLFNNLAAASEQVLPALAETREWLASQPGVAHDAEGKAEVLLCGSGSATFAVVEDGDSIRKAADIVAAAKLTGMWARSCSFAPIGVRVLDGQGAGSNLGAPRKIW